MYVCMYVCMYRINARVSLHNEYAADDDLTYAHGITLASCHRWDLKFKIEKARP